MVKITGGQRIDLLGVRKEQLPAIWEELGHAVRPRLREGGAHGQDVRRHATSAASASATRSASGIELERAMEGLYTPHKVKSAVTGCPRNCAEAYVKDIGLVAVEGGWEVYVGGAAGRDRAQGRPARARSTTSDEAIRARARLPPALPRARRSTSSAPTAIVERVGIDAGARGACSTRTAGPTLLERYRDRQGGRRPRPVAASATTPSTPSSSPSSTPSRRDADRRGGWRRS